MASRSAGSGTPHDKHEADIAYPCASLHAQGVLRRLPVIRRLCVHTYRTVVVFAQASLAQAVRGQAPHGLVGTSQSGGIFAARHMRRQSEPLNSTCVGPSATRCSKLWRVASNVTSFVAGIGSSTLLLDHALQVPDRRWSTQSRFLRGLLQVAGGGPMAQALRFMPRAVEVYHDDRPTVVIPPTSAVAPRGLCG